MGEHDISFSGASIRRNSSRAIPFDFRAGRPPRGGIYYCYACAGRRAGEIVLSGLSHSPVCDNGVRNGNPHCYPDFRSGVIHFTSGRHRRLFVRPYKLRARRVCLRKLSSSLPRSIRLRFVRAVPNLRRTIIVHATCTVRCSYISPATLGTALRFGSLPNLCNTKRFGNSDKCRRTTTRNLITKVGTTLGVGNRRPVVLSENNSCVNALVSSLIAGNYSSPCEVVADHDRCELILERSGTSVHLAPAKRGVNLVDSRECRGFLTGLSVVRTRGREIHRASIPISSRLRGVLRTGNATPLGGNYGLVRLLHEPRVACSSLGAVSAAHPELPGEIFRRIRVSIGCRNCVTERRQRVGRVHHVRSGGVPRGLSCSRLGKLELRTIRGLSGVGPRGLNRTNEVDNIGPTSITTLGVVLSSVT